MAKDEKAAAQKAAEKAAKKEERAAKRAKGKQTRGQVREAFNIQRKRDKKLIPYMLLSVLGMGLLFFLIGLLFRGQWFMLVLGLLLGAVLAMWISPAASKAPCTTKSATPQVRPHGPWRT